MSYDHWAVNIIFTANLGDIVLLPLMCTTIGILIGLLIVTLIPGDEEYGY